MYKKAILFLVLITSVEAFAHCPTPFKPEGVCLMLSENVIYFYDHKGEHNGPYKDLQKSTLESVKSNGIALKYSKVARGIYRVVSEKILKQVDIEIINEKKKTSLKLNGE
jgi:hypothetical protein